jgi:tetratricopeptide (TPR) repeat protein
LYYERQDWEKCLEASEAALAIKEKPLEYLCEAEAWGFAPYDYAAISLYWLGQFEKAVEHAKSAVEIEPSDARLQKNLVVCEAALATN